MLVLSAAIHEAIKAHGAASYPNEGCGLLLGSVEDGRSTVIEIRPLPNVWPVDEEKPERFRISEDDWRDVELEAMAGGLDVVGVFHSHPDHPPIASPRDLAWAGWSNFSYLITQVVSGSPTHSRSWQLAPDRSGFVEEDIRLTTAG